MKPYDSILDLIGDTPVVKLNTLVPAGAADVYVKLEMFNPTKSVKDRAAYNMIKMAEEQGVCVETWLQQRLERKE